MLNQFLSESFLTTATAALIAFVLFSIVLPYFNNFSGKSITIRMLLDPTIVSGALLSLLIVSLVTGLYPAFMLSSFRPLNSMKDNDRIAGRGFRMRKAFVVAQFVIT